MRSSLFLIVFLSSLRVGIAQVSIASGSAFTATGKIATNTDIINRSSKADFSNAAITLTSTASSTLSTNKLIEKVHGLIVDGGGRYTIKGLWSITDSLILTNGKIFVPATAGDELGYEGTQDIATGSDASFINGRFFMQGIGPRTFPIGNVDGYFPVRLDNVSEANVFLGFEAIKGDPNLDFSQLIGINDLLRDRFWKMTVRGSSFTGSPISISANQLSSFLLSGQAGSATILESDASKNVTDLGGVTASDFVVTTAKASPTGEIYALAKKEGVALKIGELLTPNGDGKNNVLKISNIELFPVNTVTLIDRYGVPVHKWTGFKNYSTTDSKQDFDFTTLAIGNYICVVQYTDPRTGPAKVTQMITVLK